MSILKFFSLLLLAPLVVSVAGWGQVPNVDPSKGKAAGTVSLTEPVLTIHGACEKEEKACATVVTRQEFDELMEVVAPGAKSNPGARQNAARTYAELLAFETAARKAGVLDSREFQETLLLLRLRTLADFYRRNLEKEYGAPSQEEIEDYYHREIRGFEEAKLRRIVLPKNNFAASNKEEFEKKGLRVANELRERAAKGEDLDQLQREAFAQLAFTGQPPATDVGSRRRTSLLPEVAEEIFALNPGQVSQVEKEPYSFVIYKVEARRTLPLEMVRDEISREISKRKLEDALKLVTGSVHSDLNEKYFGASAGQSSSAGQAGGPGR